MLAVNTQTAGGSINTRQQLEQLTEALLRQHPEGLSIAEKYEAISEELQASNEELASGCEELIMINAELERTKDELQNDNGALVALNETLFNRQQELTRDRNYIQGVFVTIRDPLLVIDHEFKVKMATAGFLAKFSMHSGEVENKVLFDLPGSLWQHPELKKYLAHLQPGYDSFCDIQLNTGNGDAQKSFVINARQLESVEGNTTILLSFEDVSDKRKVQENLLSLHRRNEELSHSNTELEEFASIASHDLQEPLRKMLTFANTIIEEKFDVDDHARQYLQKIGAAGGRMQQIIRDLLDYAKISDTEKTLQPVNLNEVLQNVLTDLEVVIQEKKANLLIQQLPVVPGIELYMNQLFYNLINNALKFSKIAVPPVIQIYTRPVSVEALQQQDDLDAHIPFIEIIIKDNGIGLDTSFAAKIFQPFQRINTRTAYPGTGIGLALCRKIVLQHRGKIYVTSIEGEGTEFHLLLPLQL